MYKKIALDSQAPSNNQSIEIDHLNFVTKVEENPFGFSRGLIEELNNGVWVTWNGTAEQRKAAVKLGAVKIH